MFEQMQSGKHEYPGRDLNLRNQYGNSTLFLGMVMSMMVFGWVLCYFVILIPLSLLMFDECWANMVFVMPYVVLVGVTKVILIAMRYLLTHSMLSSGGEIVYPRVFSCVWVGLIVINFAIGILASLARFFVLLPLVTFRYFSINDTMVRDQLIPLDSGYFSLLTLTYTSYQQMNPIRKSFISAINPTAHRLHGPQYKTASEVCNWEDGFQEEDQTRMATPDEVHRAFRRKVVRNRLWLSRTLHNNPGLQAFRSQALTSSDQGQDFNKGSRESVIK